MKLKIKVKTLRPVLMPKEIKIGDWVDLRTFSNYYFNGIGEYQLLNLGIAMELPKGYEAIIAPRSSTFKKYGILCANSIGIIDNSYCGDNDYWRFPAVAMRKTSIEENIRICQFRIQLSQKATVWQKIKWLFTTGIELKEVERLNNITRGGIGSTGNK